MKWSRANGPQLLGILQPLLTALSLIYCFRGSGHHLWGLLLFLLIPVLRLLFVPGYRGHFMRRVARTWGDCVAFSATRHCLPWRATGFLVVLPSALFFLGNNYVGVGDNLPVMMAASSLVVEGDWDVDEFFGLPGFELLGECPDKINGCLRQTLRGVYSSYPSGPVQFALPVAGTARLLGADLTRFPVQNRLHKWTAAWVAALSLGLFFLIALHLVDPAPAAMMTFLLATGSALCTTIGQGLWQHGGIVFWSLVALLVEFRREDKPLAWGSWIQGIACAMMLACRLTAAVVILPFGVWLLIRRPRRAIQVTTIACLAYVPWGLLYYSIYGQPFGPSMGQMSRGCWAWSATVEGLCGVLFSPGRGVFIYQVWAFLIVVAWLPLIRYHAKQSDTISSAPAGWKAFSVSALVLNHILVSAWGMWWGGWCWGSRLVSDTIPLWALLCLQPLAFLWTYRGGRRILYGLALVGFLLNGPLLYFKAEKWNGVPVDVDHQPNRVWSWSHPPFLFPFQPKE